MIASSNSQKPRNYRIVITRFEISNDHQILNDHQNFEWRKESLHSSSSKNSFNMLKCNKKTISKLSGYHNLKINGAKYLRKEWWVSLVKTGKIYIRMFPFPLLPAASLVRNFLQVPCSAHRFSLLLFSSYVLYHWKLCSVKFLTINIH